MSELILPTRRGFLFGMASLIAAPAVVKVASLMPIRGEPLVVASQEILKSFEYIDEESHTVDAMRYSLEWAKEVNDRFVESNAFIKHLHAERQKDIEFVNGTVWRFR